jgi:hypothetical protein
MRGRKMGVTNSSGGRTIRGRHDRDKMASGRKGRRKGGR